MIAAEIAANTPFTEVIQTGGGSFALARPGDHSVIVNDANCGLVFDHDVVFVMDFARWDRDAEQGLDRDPEDYEIYSGPVDDPAGMNKLTELLRGL